jgi:transcriptional regulator with XRE-family HTH domain
MYNRIRELREDKDLTQADVAKKLNMSQTGYSKYEVGAHDIPTKILIQLADFYNTSTDYILGRTIETKPYPKK